MSARRAVLALLPALLAWGRGAREARAAAEPPPISMRVDSCPPAWDSEIRLTVAVAVSYTHLTLPTILRV